MIRSGILLPISGNKGETLNQTNLLENLKRICPQPGGVTEGTPLSAHTTFRIGGPADYFVSPSEPMQLSALVKLCREENCPYLLLGNGSNLLVSDAGFRGVVIHIGKEMGEISLLSDCPELPAAPNFSDADKEKTVLYAGAGALLSSVAAFAMKRSLSDMAFASGIPGSVGGALVMNAGAYDGEISDVCAGTLVFEPERDRFCFYDREAQRFGYRQSLYQNTNCIAVGAWFALLPGNPEEIRRKTADFAERRRSKQPIELPSAGSTFKRPAGAYAAQLIDTCGLRGYRVGGAGVSEKHCGFVVNYGGASCSDVLAVMRHVRDVVARETGFVLEPEVRIVGETL